MARACSWRVASHARSARRRRSRPPTSSRASRRRGASRSPTSPPSSRSSHGRSRLPPPDGALREPTPPSVPRPRRELEDLLGGRLLGPGGWAVGRLRDRVLRRAGDRPRLDRRDGARRPGRGWVDRARSPAGSGCTSTRARSQAALAMVGAAIAGLFLTLTAATALYGLVPAAARPSVRVRHRRGRDRDRRPLEHAHGGGPGGRRDAAGAGARRGAHDRGDGVSGAWRAPRRRASSSGDAGPGWRWLRPASRLPRSRCGRSATHADARLVIVLSVFAALNLAPRAGLRAPGRDREARTVVGAAGPVRRPGPRRAGLLRPAARCGRARRRALAGRAGRGARRAGGSCLRSPAGQRRDRAGAARRARGARRRGLRPARQRLGARRRLGGLRGRLRRRRSPLHGPGTSCIQMTLGGQLALSVGHVLLFDAQPQLLVDGGGAGPGTVRGAGRRRGGVLRQRPAGRRRATGGTPHRPGRACPWRHSRT